MEPPLKTGRIGEEIACRLLESKGYVIRERNWQYRHREIDIIAQQGSELVFVEVKVRTLSPWGSAMEAVDEYKRQHMIEAANYYVRLYRLALAVRYDIIAIDIFPDRTYTIEHAERAFYPTMRRPRTGRRSLNKIRR